MRPTDMLFYEVDRRSLDATLLGVAEDERFGPFLTFDKTIFHAHGGGQKGDRGQASILRDGATTTFRIRDTRGEKGGVIRHILEPDTDVDAVSALVGSTVRLELDWAFRQAQMRLHSASHLIHVFMERTSGSELPMPRISDILEDHGLLVYESELPLGPEGMVQAMAALNAFLEAGHEIKTYPDPENPTYRFWECDNVVIPCGGTHPASTREVGAVEASLKTKKGSTKVSFQVRP